MPTVSVIIPNYNHAQYLDQRIESVLSQTYRDFEVIILDDCSSDYSREIIEKYRNHEKVSTILYNEVNSGSTFRQWVKGIELSKGKYIWIAESDDWCEAVFMQEILSGLLQDSNCVVGFCQSYCILGINTIKWQSSYQYLSNYLKGDEFIRKHMLGGNAIFNASMAVWKREAVLLISKEFMNYKYCGDWLFWIELSIHGNIFVSGKLLNYFRKHDNDVSSKVIRSGESFIEEITMFNLLYSRKWISYNDLIKILRPKYIHYKAIGQHFNPDKRIQIVKLFIAHLQSKSALRYFYLGSYTNHIIQKIFRYFRLGK